MWRRLVRSWNALWGRTVELASAQPPEFLPAKLIADLQRLVYDELRGRERKRRADRFQQAGATASASAIASVAIFVFIANDLSPRLPIVPEDTLILLGTLVITVAIVVWNVLGWAGARYVPFTWLLWGLAFAAFFCV